MSKRYWKRRGTIPEVPAAGRVATSLQSVEDRLRLLFGLSGDIGASLLPALGLTVDAGTLVGPGTNSYRGRRFAAFVNLTSAAIATVSFKAFDDLIISNLEYIGATGALELLVAVEDATPADITSYLPVGTWTERITNTTAPDRAPLGGHNAVAYAPRGIGISYGRYPSNTLIRLVQGEIHLPRGARIYVHAPTSAPATFASVNIEGRVF